MSTLRAWYDRHLLPSLLDFGCGMPPIARLRRAVVPVAGGRVLEVGIGTGLNLPFYERAHLTSLVGIDPAGQMQPRARRRSGEAGLPVVLHAGTAERMPFDAAAFDSVVCTFSLCSIPDPAAALAEMRRVLRPGGRLLIAEHGLAPDLSVARWQARLEPWWSHVAGGCHLTRDVPRLLREAGFEASLHTGYIARPRALAFGYWGEAVRG